MSEQFLFFCTNIGNEKLLKEEIRIFYPDFNFSYSRKGFITFKNKGIQYTPDTISQLQLTFATRSGICLGKSTPENILQHVTEVCETQGLSLANCILHNFSINTDYVYDAEGSFDNVNAFDNSKDLVINLMALGDKEIWLGIHKVEKNIKCFPNNNPNIPLPESSPSKAYLKIAEAVELFKVGVNSTERWMDFGSAPGGAAHFLLEKGCQVWGVDPAKMDEKIRTNKNYRHFSIPVQDLSHEKLPKEDIHWVHVDLNLNPKQAIKEVLRLCKNYSQSLKGIIFTVQLVKMEYVKNIEDFEDLFFDWGFTDIISRQTPAHKNEYCIVARR